MQAEISLPQPQPAAATPLASGQLLPDPSVSKSTISISQIISMIVTLIIAVGLGVLATITATQFAPGQTRVLWLAIAVGGLGGLAHEVAQSGGTILIVERREDGIYLGAIAGVILGAVAGLLAVKGLLIDQATPPGATELIYEAFIAGLALKGITEAAGGQALPAGSANIRKT